MAEAVAQEKYHCPSCGADAHWNAAKQALVCPYCGTVAPAVLDQATGKVQENDLAEALRRYSTDHGGWKAEKVSVRCQSCQAISVFDPSRVAQRCEFCGSAQLVPYEQIKAPISPESVLPFKITETQVRDSVRRWYGSRWFAPNRLRKGALTDVVKGIYLPYWTFDAEAYSHWTAESGYHYYTTETYRDAQGNSRARQVQHTRWESSSGSLTHFFDDALVPASRGVQPGLLREIEPFATTDLIPYDAGFLAGWVVEQYQIDLIAAAQQSRERMDQEMRGLCAAQVPGDTHRNLQVRTEYSKQTFKHILLPIWMLSFNYGSKAYQVIINGENGAIAGKYPLSAVKIILAVIAALIAAGIIYLVTQ